MEQQSEATTDLAPVLEGTESGHTRAQEAREADGNARGGRRCCPTTNSEGVLLSMLPPKSDVSAILIRREVRTGDTAGTDEFLTCFVGDRYPQTFVPKEWFDLSDIDQDGTETMRTQAMLADLEARERDREARRRTRIQEQRERTGADAAAQRKSKSPRKSKKRGARAGASIAGGGPAGAGDSDRIQVTWPHSVPPSLEADAVLSRRTVELPADEEHHEAAGRRTSQYRVRWADGEHHWVEERV
jgi:hypothetical protein